MRTEKRTAPWPKVPIKAVYSGFFDGVHGTPKVAAEGPVFLGIKNITEDGHLDLSDVRHIAEEDFPKWTRRVEPHPGDIVFTYEATLNRYAIIPKGFRGCLGRRLGLIRPDPQKVDTRFLFYYFFGDEWRRTIATNTIPGATVERIPIISFPDFQITRPPLPTQHRIAAILSAYDDLIENNNRRIRILEEMARLIYHEWFVEFRFPGHENARMVESPAGRVPEGWGCKLGEVVELAYGKALKAEDRVPGPFPVFGSGGVVGYHGESLVKGPGVIVGRKGNVGSVHWSQGDFFPIDTTFFVRTGLPLTYVYFGLQSQNFVNNDAAVPGLNRNQAYLNAFLVPPRSLLTRFDHVARPTLRMTHNARTRNQVLRETRELVLPRLMSGQIDITGASKRGIPPV